MLSRYLSLFTILMVIFCIHAAYSQRDALVLRQERLGGSQGNRYGTTSSGRYQGGNWVKSPTRQSAGSFRGGGPGAGK